MTDFVRLKVELCVLDGVCISETLTEVLRLPDSLWLSDTLFVSDFVILCERVIVAEKLGVSGMGILFVSLRVADGLSLREVEALRVSEALTEWV